jgi:hypothetical protein
LLKIQANDNDEKSCATQSCEKDSKHLTSVVTVTHD